MALFGKRKKAEVLGSAVKESINEAEQTQKTQQQLMQNRSVRNRIEEGFFDEDELSIIKRARNHKGGKHPKNCDVITTDNDLLNLLTNL